MKSPTLFRRRGCEKVAPSGQFETQRRIPVTCPSMTDGLSTLYQDLLRASYDCVNRIVLNAYFRMGHDPGGFRVWWRALTGSDETLERPPDADVRSIQPSHSRLCQSARHSRDRLFGRATQTRARGGVSGQDQDRTGLVSGPGRSGTGAGVGRQREAPPRKKEPHAVREPLFVSHSRPGLGPSDDPDQWASSLPRPGDLERP